jgi:hypothetical protein
LSFLARQVRDHHQILVIHRTGTTQDGTDPACVPDAVRHVTGANSGAEPPAATPDFNAPAMVDRVLSELADARSGVTLVIDDLHELRGIFN